MQNDENKMINHSTVALSPTNVLKYDFEDKNDFLINYYILSLVLSSFFFCATRPID